MQLTTTFPQLADARQSKKLDSIAKQSGASDLFDAIDAHLATFKSQLLALIAQHGTREVTKGRETGVVRMEKLSPEARTAFDAGMLVLLTRKVDLPCADTLAASMGAKMRSTLGA